MPPEVSIAAAIVALAWAGVSGWLAIGAIVRRRQLVAKAKLFVMPDLRKVRVLLIRPCAGSEPSLAECLRSAAAARHSFELDVAHGVASPDDEALPTIRTAAESLSGAGVTARIEVVEPNGPNQKASTIAGIVSRTNPPYDVILNADSNIDLTDFDLDQLVGRIVVGGAAWSPFVEHAHGKGLGTRANVAFLGGALTSFPILAGLSARNMSGKLWGVRPEVMESAGGFAELANYLGEDFEMERRLHAGGVSVVPTPTTAMAVAPTMSVRDALRRHSRWMHVVRAQRPSLMPAYPLLMANTPLTVALAGFGMMEAPAVGATAAGLAILSRLLVASAAAIIAGRGWGPLQMVVDSVLADLFILTAWTGAFMSREVVWRNNVLSIGERGRLRPVPRLPA